MENAVHLVWSTDGSMVPKEEMEEYSRIGFSFVKKWADSEAVFRYNLCKRLFFNRKAIQRDWCEL